MGRPGVPAYGAHFTLQHLPYEPGQDIAPRAYVLRIDPAWSIRSDRTSKHWVIFVAGPAGAQFPLGGSDATLAAAMRRARVLHAAAAHSS